MIGTRGFRGLSEIVGALLLIVITVVSAVLLYEFVSTFMVKALQSPSLSSFASISPFEVTAVSYSGGGFTVYVLNLGPSPITIVQAVAGQCVATNVSVSPAPVPPGAVGVVRFSCPPSPYITLISNQGVWVSAPLN